MDKIEQWATQNRCEINQNKTKILEINNKNSNEEQFGQYQIVEEYKYLGMIIDKKLKMK